MAPVGGKDVLNLLVQALAIASFLGIGSYLIGF